MSALIALALLGVAAPARAQIGTSVSLQSDYIYRGRSLSDGEPALTLAVSYDHSSGLYLGGSATAQDTDRQGVEFINRVAYAGYVVRPSTGPALDLGVSSTRVTDYRTARRAFDYAEVYAGVLGDHLSFHLHYAPDYYESGIRTLYTDLGAAIRPSENLRIFAHAGALVPVGGRSGPGTRRTRYDFSAGLAHRFEDWELSLTWTRISPALRIGGRRERDAITVGAAYFF